MIAGSSGCGRFAENEEDGPVRARKELETIAIPLGAEWVDGYGSGGWGYERIDVDHWPAFPIFFRAASGASPQPNPWPRNRVKAFLDGWTHGGLYAEAEAKLAASMPHVNYQGINQAALANRLPPQTFHLFGT
jgi:hypothetical protein